jgi:hypothetical protein
MRAIARAALSDGESIRDEDAAGGVAVGGREAGAMAISGRASGTMWERSQSCRTVSLSLRCPLHATEEAKP